MHNKKLFNIRKDKVLLFATVWMDLESIMLNEICQKEEGLLSHVGYKESCLWVSSHASSGAMEALLFHTGFHTEESQGGFSPTSSSCCLATSQSVTWPLSICYPNSVCILVCLDFSFSARCYFFVHCPLTRFIPASLLVLPSHHDHAPHQRSIEDTKL